MNTEQNKIKRRDFLVRLQQLQAVGKSIGYMDETNFNLWSSRTRRHAVKKMLAGGGQNLQMVAYIGKVGVIHYEMKLGSNKYQHSNEFVRNTLRKFADVSKVVVVLYNTPCNARAFKSAVKDFMTERRAEIIAVPPGTTMKAHLQHFPIEAAETLFPRVTTAQLCASCYYHTLRFLVKVAALEGC
ncbi:hypothetical protein PHYSODRAFT_318407 [Phytophthora sojae]|uniref:Tc1-like transposase DDE domain-containing protein n=1 Tax=Phytophthora sojae (strain P6497) TaxID=1094619 RepID=G5A2M6_PHYSP|nr:hypothetical protein PHYSODRAFT_318407 [Phytophthora sojae]EGZ09916.1 hypothetical protein PHYSODRAFT_318407 [Phytophthora sojae]|eukprot:XP_009534777.1 hypothetical protein PHYSODRAFT_318407 [Phytophthora sojae]